ncbi:mediator of RNA polymerase II transcription subunit 30-like [Planococcus citri]|uniref:mediator of RNA polymerase II transcription subunit 30-like n=1 Tax=Planococcus citri TaxID=170843 RepID=UPI0031F72BDA
MAGPPHPFPPNFGGAPQNDMRSQFGGPRSGQLAGISSPGQQSVAGIASPQTYNVGVNMQQQADSPISAQQMQQNAQQTSQQLQMQMQQRQQTPSQQQQESVQQAQQVGAVQAQVQQQTIPQPQQNAFPPQSSLPQHSAVPNTGGGPNMGARMAPGDGSIQSVAQSAIQPDNAVASAGASGPVPQQPPANQQFNTASLCKYGQEIVQDIVCKVQDMFQILRVIMPPNGAGGPTNTISNDKKLKLQEYLRGIKGLFKRLRLIYEKCNDNSQLQGMEYMHIESLIPLKEEWDVKTSEERKTSEAYRLATEECKDLIDQVVLKNSQLKEIIDHMRKIVWEINTMLTMKKS